MYFRFFLETGNYLALDLGGTNFRVLLIIVNGSEVTMKSRIYTISNETMVGPGEQVSWFKQLIPIKSHNR